MERKRITKFVFISYNNLKETQERLFPFFFSRLLPYFHLSFLWSRFLFCFSYAYTRSWWLYSHRFSHPQYFFSTTQRHGLVGLGRQEIIINDELWRSIQRADPALARARASAARYHHQPVFFFSLSFFLSFPMCVCVSWCFVSRLPF